MAEAPESEPTPSSSENLLVEKIKDVDEPLPKKRKINESDATDKLEYRLGGILCCAVCLDLPQAAVYQCSNGHLMCAPCFTHLLADARLRDESATCPNCRIEISKTSASRNLAVEKTVSELPLECKYCACVFPRHSLQHHEEQQCDDREYKFTQIVFCTASKRPYLDGLVRIVTSVYTLLMSALRRSYLLSEVSGARRRYRRLTGCKYACIGCPWRGPAHEASAHESRCAHPHKSAGELLDTLAERDRLAREEHLIYNQLLDLLSYEKITFTDLQLKPYRTEDYVHKLYYESSRFPAFSQQWVVKAFVNNNQRDPTQSTQRDITYQLILKSKGWGGGGGGAVQWVATRGPWGEARLVPRVSAHVFREEEAEAPAQALPLADPDDANRLLATKAIHFRLIMFLTSK